MWPRKTNLMFNASTTIEFPASCDNDTNKNLFTIKLADDIVLSYAFCGFNKKISPVFDDHPLFSCLKHLSYFFLNRLPC